MSRLDLTTETVAVLPKREEMALFSFRVNKFRTSTTAVAIQHKTLLSYNVASATTNNVVISG